MMDTREEIIRLWLDMWLRQEDFGIRDILDPSTGARTRSGTGSGSGTAGAGCWPGT